MKNGLFQRLIGNGDAVCAIDDDDIDGCLLRSSYRPPPFPMDRPAHIRGEVIEPGEAGQIEHRLP